MIAIQNLAVVVILIWVCIYTASFGRWTWKKKNKLGAVMVFLIALAVLVLPFYTLFFRH